jgi:2-polyprenyl-3-methyl-5-hydroxy-6-metoxy-1,4-benzoquinol methylase
VTDASFRERAYDLYVSSGQSIPTAADLRARGPFLRRMIRRHFPSDRDAAIVDVGCGYGSVLHYAQEAGYTNVTGVDISLEQVEGARGLGIEGVRQGDVTETVRAFPDSSQDVILTLDVIEHFDRDALLPFADDVHRALKPGGRWLINVPNGESPFFGRVRYGDITHELAFTRTSMTQLLAMAGFDRVSCHENDPAPHGPASIVRWILWRLFRAVMLVYITAETGDRRAVFTQNFLTVGTK